MHSAGPAPPPPASHFRRHPGGGRLFQGAAYAELSFAVSPRAPNDTGPGGALGLGFELLVEIPHTFTPPCLRGTGLAGRLCELLFEQAQASNLRVRPTCSYVSGTFLSRRPELARWVGPPAGRNKRVPKAILTEAHKVGSRNAKYPRSTTRSATTL